MLLRREMDELGSLLEEDCWLTSALICAPQKGAIATEEQVEYCRPNVMNLIEEKQPEKIFLLGGAAVRSVLGAIWKPKPGGIGLWAGFQIPSQKLNAWICPIFHPSYVLKSKDKDNKKHWNPATEVWWKRHLAAAMRLEGRPHKKIREYDKEINILWTKEDIIRACQLILEDGLPIAIDYETNGLKPDAPEMRLYSVALSNGKRTFSFLFSSGIKDALAKVLFSDLPKIGANIKFEQRWTIAKFGRPIKNMRWDGNIAAHIMDNRQGVTSVKFNALALLGYSGNEKQHRYDEVVRAYFDSAGGNEPNRIQDLDISQLLHYGGLDALLEWEIARVQRKRFS